MKVSSSLKKTISLAAVLAASNAMANPTTPDEALDQLSGPNQDMTAPSRELCVEVDPYFIRSRLPHGTSPGVFVGFVVAGASRVGPVSGSCREVEAVTGLCERGYVKINTTAPVLCTVPVAL